MTPKRESQLTEATRKRIEAKHRESVQRVLAAEVISLELLKQPTEAATYQLVQQVALVDDANKRRAAAAAIMTESKRLEEAYASRALRSMDHARNLAMMQVESEALEAAAIIHRLT